MALVAALMLVNFLSLWIQAKLTQSDVGLTDLFGMKFRNVNPRIIVRSMIMASQARLQDPDITSRALEAHLLAGGNVPQVIKALIAAKKAKIIELGFSQAAAIDLADAMFWKRYKPAFIPKSSIARQRVGPSQVWMPWPKTVFN